METNSLFMRALCFAADAHGTQVRKYTGTPYILHPIAVARIVETVPHTEDMLAAALLHDVLEDTVTTYNELYDRFGRNIACMVAELTDNDKEGNRAERKAKECERLALVSSQVKTIKLADLIHNTDDIVPHDKHFGTIYLEEKTRLLTSLVGGDPSLWYAANQQVLKWQTHLMRERIRP